MVEERKELFSEKVSASSRTYFFDVKESAGGAKYLAITESKKSGEGTFDRRQIMVFQEHLSAFKDGLEKAEQFIAQVDKT